LRPTAALILASLSLLALLPMASAATTTTYSGPSSGSVTYAVTANGNGTTEAATITETITPSSTAGQSILSLASSLTLNLPSMSPSSSNFTYSHDINSSSAMFPYLPAISGTNYTYSGKNVTIAAKISQSGTSQATFQGKAYTMTDYSFSLAITTTNGTQTVTGTIAAFPSDLVYSFTGTANSGTIQATLTSTSLPLTAGQAAPALQAASAGIGISLAVGAIALSLGVRMKRHSGTAGTANPDHWVD